MDLSPETSLSLVGWPALRCSRCGLQLEALGQSQVGYCVLHRREPDRLSRCLSGSLGDHVPPQARICSLSPVLGEWLRCSPAGTPFRDDEDTILKDLQMGSITSAHPLDYSKLAEYRRLSNYVLTTALTSSSFEALFFNFHNRVLSTHLEVRLAMAEAIDHKALIAGLPQGHGVPLCTDHGSFYHPGYQPQPDCPVFDSAAANKLLDDNGWVRGTDGVRARQGQRLDFEYVTTLVTAPWRTAVGALIQRNLKEIGIKFDVQYYPLREA